MPEGFFPKEKKEPFLAETLEWCKWLYLVEESFPTDEDRAEFVFHLDAIEEAILEERNS